MAGTARITGTYPLEILPDRQCPGCPAGMTGGILHSGEWYCWPHYDVVATHPDAWQDMGDYYTGPTYMEYDEESW